MDDLTERSHEILTLMIQYQNKHGVCPSAQQVANECGLKRHTAWRHIRRLVRAGRIKKSGKQRWELLYDRHVVGEGEPVFAKSFIGLRNGHKVTPLDSFNPKRGARYRLVLERVDA